MLDTKFFVELPADEYGNTARQRAVIEARVEVKDGREILIPVAPRRFAKGWPTGWYRDQYGGWAETEGPARMLTYEEHQQLIASLPQEARQGRGEIVALKNGEKLPNFLVNVVLHSLHTLIQQNPIAFYELVQACRNPQHQLFGSTGRVLVDRGLVEHVDEEKHADIHDITRSVVLSAVSGEGVHLTLGSPLAT